MCFAIDVAAVQPPPKEAHSDCSASGRSELTSWSHGNLPSPH